MNNIWVTWGDVFNASLQDLWWGFVQFAPKLIVAIILFIIGWVLGSVISKAFVHVFGALKIDRLFQSVRADDLLRRAGMSLNTGRFVGEVARWFVIIVFLIPSLNLVGLDDVTIFLREDVLGYLPQVFIAAFVLIIAAVFSEFLSKAIVAGSKAMNLASANLLGTIAKYAIWIFALIIALGYLGLGSYMSILFSGVIGMLALGGALAFGLGGRDAAARFLAKLSEEASDR